MQIKYWYSLRSGDRKLRRVNITAFSNIQANKITIAIFKDSEKVLYFCNFHNKKKSNTSIIVGWISELG